MMLLHSYFEWIVEMGKGWERFFQMIILTLSERLYIEQLNWNINYFKRC